MLVLSKLICSLVLTASALISSGNVAGVSASYPHSRGQNNAVSHTRHHTTAPAANDIIFSIGSHEGHPHPRKHKHKLRSKTRLEDNIQSLVNQLKTDIEEEIVHA